MQLQVHSHVGAAQCEHTPLLPAAEQLCRTDGPKSKECISSSVNVEFKFRFNEHAAAALFVCCYDMSQNIVLLLLLSFAFKDTILFTVSHRSASARVFHGAFIHTHSCY